MSSASTAAVETRSSIHSPDSLAARSLEELDALYQAAAAPTTMRAADSGSSGGCSRFAGCRRRSPR